MKFAEKLKTLREQKKVTQKAAAAGTGVTLRAYTGYERDGRYPRDRDIYRRLAEFFGCDINYLLTEDESFVILAEERYGLEGKQQAEALVAEITGLFAGGKLAEEDQDEMMKAIMDAYWIAKRKNRRRFSGDDSGSSADPGGFSG